MSKLWLVFPVLILLSSCTTSSCNVGPTVEIDIEKTKKEDQETKQSTEDLIKESVKPGGRINCSF